MTDKSRPRAETVEVDVKQSVKEFYDSVGWRGIGEGLYQNARYEDLRPVSREYIHRCHLRVARHLQESGRFLLDAGSGPIQYPEYLEYSAGYQKRVCLDISNLALKEARGRIGDHGIFVVGDIANLPFACNVFDGLVSLHTVHHLPPNEQEMAFMEFLRVLSSGRGAVVVYSWGQSALLARLAKRPIQLINSLIEGYRKLRKIEVDVKLPSGSRPDGSTDHLIRATGTYTHKFGYVWAKEHLAFLPHLDIRIWRSLSTAMLRSFFHGLLGSFMLRIVYWFEERSPHLMGRIGQYPMILFQKEEDPSSK
jgi:hypothetical protein